MHRVMTNFIIFLAASISGLLNFAGLSELTPDGDWWMLTLFALTSIVVTGVLTLFWRYAFSIVPELSVGNYRWSGWMTVLVGVVGILCVSTYWNVVSLARGEINRLANEVVVETVAQDVARTFQFLNQFRTFKADVTAFATDTRLLQQQEIDGGGSSGAPKAGPVSSTFGQVADRLETLTQSLATVTAEQDKLQLEIGACEAQLSSALATDNHEGAREAAACINRALAVLAGQNPSALIVRAFTELTSGVVVPANVRTDNQRVAITSFLEETKRRGAAIAASIEGAAEQPSPQPIVLEHHNVFEGVLIHWKALIPPISTAIAIDLIPLVLLVFTTLRFDDQNGRGNPKGNLTLNELQDAALQITQLQRLLIASHQHADEPDYIDLTPKPNGSKRLDVPPSQSDDGS